MNYNEIFRTVRKRKGIKQKEMVAHIGCSLGHYSKLENGRLRDVRLSEIFLICEALGLHCELNISPAGDPGE